MTVNTTTNKINAPGDGIQTNFPYNFKVTVATQMLVYLDNVLYGAAYTVNGVGNDAGGSVDIAVPPGIGVIVTLYRYVPEVQETDYEPYRAFPSQTVEDDMDLSVMRDQQLDEENTRALVAPINDDGTFDYTIPPPVLGYILIVNATGDGFEWVAPTGISYPNVPYARITYRVAYNVAGGAATTGWDFRPINTIEEDDDLIITSIATPTIWDITLPAGLYRLRAKGAVGAVAWGAARLYDSTGAAILVGPGAPIVSGSAENKSAETEGRFTLAIPSVVRLQTYSKVNVAGTGFGVASNEINLGDNVFTTIELWKES